MGDLKVTIEHGSGLGSLLNAKTVVIGAAAVVIVASGGLSGVESGLQDLLCWVAGILGVVVAVGGYLIFRATRRGWKPDYVRSIHGPTQHDLELDKMAELRREIALTRAARYQLEVARRMQADMVPDYITAEVIDR